MNEQDVINYVDKIGLVEKLSIYMDYYISMLSLKHNFEVVDLERFLLKNVPSENKNLSPYQGYGKPDKEFKGIAFYYLWKDLKIKTFEQFCDKSNIVINDTKCDDWKERGFAQKSWITLNPQSIFYYIYKHKN